MELLIKGKKHIYTFLHFNPMLFFFYYSKLQAFGR